MANRLAWIVLINLLIFLLLPPVALSGSPEPTPTVDRLAIPVLPDNPTQFDLGLQVYYYNCMPCHGDSGQGLTDEWMSVWEEDHQNCWGRGCHGQNENYTFFIPTVVPPLVGVSKSAVYGSENRLYQYLKTTHPPQNPGKLADEDYHSVSVYLMHLNGFDKNMASDNGYAKSINLPFLPQAIPITSLVYAAALSLLVTSGLARSLEKRIK